MIQIVHKFFRVSCALNKKMQLTMLMFLFFWMGLAGCAQPTDDQFAREIQNTSTDRTTGKPGPTTSTRQTHDPLPLTPGPFLLIQSDFTEYKIFDLSTGISTPFHPPVNNPVGGLGVHFSPGGRKMFFLSDQGEILLTDLITGKILDTFPGLSDKTHFQPDLTLQKARSLFGEMPYSDETLIDFIGKAYQESISNIRWYQSDRYLLSPQDMDPTSTSLSLYDLESDSLKPLETQPGLVLDYWIGPDKEKILLKKGYINEAGFWLDNSYYVLNVPTKVIRPVPFPDLVDNPTLFWLDAETIGITHQIQPIGGIGFSTYNLTNNNLSQVIKDAFTHIRRYGEKLLILQYALESQQTIATFTTFNGEVINQQIINDRCFFKSQVNNYILLNCEADSLFFDETLQFTPFGGLVSLLAPGPGGDSAIVVTRDETIFLINQISLEQQPIALEGMPIEIRWLPDASGFLYRVSEYLFFYDFNTRESRLLFTSPSLGDYSNINAEWINVE